MNVIAMGYMGTGSSAINHLLSEYENTSIACKKEYEHVLFYMPHGLFDLETVLLENNLLFRSDAAINDFYSAMKTLNDGYYGWFGSYKKFYGNKFMEIVDEFIDRIIQFTREGANWFNDYRYHVSLKAVIKDTAKTILHRNVKDFGHCSYIVGDNKVNYSFVSSEEFYSAAKEFVRKYMELASNGNDGVILFDQLLKPQNLHKLPKYFDNDVRCIVFKRDVRDMYVNSKYVWSRNTGRIILPSTPDSFVDFYSRFFKTEKPIEDRRILRMNFEDLVYNYDDTVRKIENFIGKDYLGEHIRPKTKFNPDISVKNTQVFRIEERYEKEVEFIAEHMSENLYDFPYVLKPKIEETSDPA
jgi:hypothetical protein